MMRKIKGLADLYIYKNNLQPLHLSAFENNPTLHAMDFVHEGTTVAKV